MDISSAINQLANIISNTQEFNRLKTIRDEINKDGYLSTMLSEFEAKQKQFYTSVFPQDKTQQLITELNNEFNRLNAYPLLKQYFAAEQAYNEVIANIIKSLNEILEQKIQ